MSARRRVGGAIAVILVMPAALAAQRPAPILDQPGLRDYVAEVFRRNRGYAAARTEVDAAGWRIAPAGALPDPVVSVGAMYAQLPDLDMREEGMSMFGIRLQQMLPSPGKQNAAAQVAREERGLADAEAAVLRATLAAKAAGAYFDVAYARSALLVWRTRLDLADQAVRAALSRYSTGAAPQAEALRAQVRRARVQEEGHSFAAAVEQAEAEADALRGGRGDGLQVPPLVGPDSTVLLAALSDSLPEGELLRSVFEGASPTVALAKARVQRARAAVHALGIAARPDFMLMAEYAPRLGRDPFLTGMIGFSVPLWAFRKQGPAAHAARLDHRAAEEQYQDGLARLEAELRDRTARLRALQGRIREHREQVLPLAHAASASALASYAVGRVDLSTVLDAQDELFEAHLNVARLIAAYGKERAALSALLGEEWYR